MLHVFALLLLTFVLNVWNPCIHSLFCPLLELQKVSTVVPLSSICTCLPLFPGIMWVSNFSVFICSSHSVLYCTFIIPLPYSGSHLPSCHICKSCSLPTCNVKYKIGEFSCSFLTVWYCCFHNFTSLIELFKYSM